MPGPRAVLDTSVLVSAILRPDGPSGAVLRAARRGRFVMIASPAILDDLVDVLTRPKLRAQAGLTFEDVAKIRVGLQQFAETVPGAYRDVDAVPTDPKDNPVVAAALEGEADHLVPAGLPRGAVPAWARAPPSAKLRARSIDLCPIVSSVAVRPWASEDAATPCGRDVIRYRPWGSRGRTSTRRSAPG